jgi:WD40 repeat protein
MIVSASEDCTIRLWKLTPEPIQVRLIAKHAQPISFVVMSERFKQAISVSRDGFLLSMSIRDGRYLRGFRLPLSDPSHLTVSEIGFVVVGFNGPDSHVVVVLDQNLKFVVRQGFDRCIQCWDCLEIGGMDHLIVVLKAGGLQILRIPLLVEIAHDFEIPFQPVQIACWKGECFMTSQDGEVWSFPISGKLVSGGFSQSNCGEKLV